MESILPVRVSLDHSPPWWDEDPEWFVTICTDSPKVNSLCLPEVAGPLLEGVEQYHQSYKWFADIVVVMPDHVHFIVSIPDKTSLSEVMRNFKRWSAKRLSIAWQRGFFEHRLRSYPSANQKFKYVMNNPVRAGLVSCPEEWPYTFIGGNRESGRLGITAPTKPKVPAR